MSKSSSYNDDLAALAKERKIFSSHVVVPEGKKKLEARAEDGKRSGKFLGSGKKAFEESRRLVNGLSLPRQGVIRFSFKSMTRREKV